MKNRTQKTRQITIRVQRVSGGVFLATSEDLPGLIVESEDGEAIFDLARDLAIELLELSGEATGPVSFEFTLESGDAK